MNILKDSEPYFITGASGFIASNLIREILKKDDGKVHALIRPGSNLWRFKDIRDKVVFHEAEIYDASLIKTIIKKINPSKVFHLIHYGGNAGQHDKEKTRQVIIEGTAVLYDACANINSIKTIVNAGSSSEYGKKNEPMKEDMLPDPNTEYSVAKVWANLYGRHLARESGLPIVNARIFSAYGYFEHRNRFFTEVIISCLKKEKPKLANPHTARDFVFITDVVSSLLRLAQKGQVGETYNIGSGHESTLGEAAELIAKYTDYEAPLEWGSYESREFDTSKWQADISKTYDKLGWKAEISLEEGIKKDVDWFKKNIGLYERI